MYEWHNALDGKLQPTPGHAGSGRCRIGCPYGRKPCRYKNVYSVWGAAWELSGLRFQRGLSGDALLAHAEYSRIMRKALDQEPRETARKTRIRACAAYLRPYSDRSAWIGLSRAARRAGKKPNPTPIAVEIVVARMIALAETVARDPSARKTSSRTNVPANDMP
jgi:hypothetical protein